MRAAYILLLTSAPISKQNTLAKVFSVSLSRNNLNVEINKFVQQQ